MRGGADIEDDESFYSGAITVYCEKVALGTSKASMLKPNSDMRSHVREEVARIVRIYDLTYHEHGEEFWICRVEDLFSVLQALKHDVNSPQWHQARGRLFGIPESEIDPHYHLRKAHGAKEKKACSDQGNDETSEG